MWLLRIDTLLPAGQHETGSLGYSWRRSIAKKPSLHRKGEAPEKHSCGRLWIKTWGLRGLRDRYRSRNLFIQAFGYDVWLVDNGEVKAADEAQDDPDLLTGFRWNCPLRKQ